MLLFHEVVTLLRTLDPQLSATLQYIQLSKFFAAVARLASLILLNAPRRTVGVPMLPEPVRHSLAHILHMSLKDVDSLWDVFGHTALHQPSCDLFPQPAELDKALSTLAAAHPVGAEILVSPHRHCTTTGCKDLGKPLQSTHKPFRAHLFTVQRGVLPVRVVTLYCKACKTTYRPNYSVTQADSPLSVRRYNTGVADAIEAGEHYYVDSTFMSLVRAQMAFAQ
ncbi:hypothetical protein C8T65DRAFT_757020 [Cerioporus squamosus]|nr:hypothetical protein C8T65DRAFT_757020 [Cerioporus squamosus]